MTPWKCALNRNNEENSMSVASNQNIIASQREGSGGPQRAGSKFKNIYRLIKQKGV